MREHKCYLIMSTTSNPSSQISGMKLAVPPHVHTSLSSQQKPFNGRDTKTLPSAMYQTPGTQTCSDPSNHDASKLLGRRHDAVAYKMHSPKIQKGTGPIL